MDMRYGIGRVPADVDPTDEAFAELEAQAIMAELTAGQAPRFAPAGTTPADPDDTGTCAACGRPGWWNSGAGQDLCAQHWDEY